MGSTLLNCSVKRGCLKGGGSTGHVFNVENRPMIAPTPRDDPTGLLLRTTDELKRELLRRAPSPSSRPVAWTTSLAFVELIIDQASATPDWQLVQGLLDQLLPAMQALLPTDWEHSHPDDWILLFDVHTYLCGLARDMSTGRA